MRDVAVVAQNTPPSVNEDKNVVIATLRSMIEGLTALVDKLDACDPDDIPTFGLLFCDMAEQAMELEFLLAAFVVVIEAAVIQTLTQEEGA